jgi:hypothetical protein
MPNKDTSPGEGQRKTYYSETGKASISAHLRGTDRSFRFKQRKNWEEV